MDIIRHRKLLLFGHICRMPHDRLVKKVLLGSVYGVLYGREEDLQRNGQTTLLSWSCVKLRDCCKIERHGGKLYLSPTVANQGTRRRRRIQHNL